MSEDLVVGLGGSLTQIGDDGFEQAVFSRVFNRLRPDRHPVAALKPETVEDIVAGVKLARERGWQITARAGGHSWSVWSVRDGAMLIDMANFNTATYDAETGIAVAGPAIKGGSELNPYLAEHGRFFHGGHCPTVGIGGFLLQGGMGWNCRGHSWAVENVVGVDVVTASGEVLHCNAEQNQDLFWAARGSGPGFPAIVTAFHLQTEPRYTTLTTSKYFYPGELADEVLGWIYDERWNIDDTVELVMVALDAGTIPGLDHEGPLLVVDALSFASTPEEGARALAPLETCPVLDQAVLKVVAVPDELANRLIDQERANPEDHYYVVDNAYVAGDRAAVVEALTPAFSLQPTPKSFAIWYDMGRAPERGLPDMALSLQTDIYFAAYLVGEDEQQARDCLDWITARGQEIDRVKAGIYLGDSDLLRHPGKFMSDEAYARLQEIRRARDPDGLFCDYIMADGVTPNTNDRPEL